MDRGFSLHSRPLLGLHLCVRMLYLSLLGKNKIKKNLLFANHLSSISYPILKRDLYPQMFSPKHQSQSLQHKSHPRRFATHMLMSNSVAQHLARVKNNQYIYLYMFFTIAKCDLPWRWLVVSHVTFKLFVIVEIELLQFHRYTGSMHHPLQYATRGNIMMHWLSGSSLQLLHTFHSHLSYEVWDSSSQNYTICDELSNHLTCKTHAIKSPKNRKWEFDGEHWPFVSKFVHGIWHCLHLLSWQFPPTSSYMCMVYDTYFHRGHH